MSMEQNMDDWWIYIFFFCTVKTQKILKKAEKIEICSQKLFKSMNAFFMLPLFNL